MSGKTIHEADRVEPGPPTRKLSCLEAMTERKGEISCFTPALLVTHGHMPLDPLNEFVARFNVPEEGRPFCVEIPPPTLPFFAGLGVTVQNNEPVDWDRRLYAVPKKYADDCFKFLGGIGVTSGDFFASAVAYELNVPDPTMPQFNTPAHTIPIVVFGVLRDNKITYLEPNGIMPPFVKTIPATAIQRSNNMFKSGLSLEDFKEIRGEL